MRIQKRYFLVILILLTSAALSSCSKKSSGSGIVQHRMGSGVTQSEENQMQQAQVSTEENEAGSDLYIVTKINRKKKKISFQKVSSGRQTQYAYDTGTLFLDKYEDTRSVESFLPGDVVEIEILSNPEKLVSVQLSDEVWVYDDIVNYSLDPENGAITIGETKYSCNPDMDIFSGAGVTNYAGIGAEDVLKAVGVGREVISLAVTKGHGYLALANTKLFEGSFICVGDKIFEEVTQNMQIQVPEGSYLVTVANNGYGGSREITVERDKTISLNLDELKGEGPKICKAVFDVGVEGARLFIDGKQVNYSGPVEISYGVHTIIVDAEGYDPITRKLVVNSQSAEIEIALTESSGLEDDKEKEDKKSEEKKDNNKKNNANSTDQNAGSQNNNTGNNTNNTANNNADNNNNASQSDYLTTLYNLLTSINNTNGSKNNSSTEHNSNTGDSYDDLRDQ